MRKLSSEKMNRSGDIEGFKLVLSTKQTRNEIDTLNFLMGIQI